MQKANIHNSLNEIENTLTHCHNLEPITDELIQKLNKEKKIPIKDLKELQKQGAKYSQIRSSFFFPPKLECFD